MLDYKKLGLKAGLEIHQQLDTHKLFCNCPSVIREDDPDLRIKRVLFPSPGETGVIDKAALEERKKGKYFIYEVYNDTNCLVELDEEPPKEINKEALKIALIIAKFLKMNIFDEIHVMRKTVVDGSNTSGFQRTALIAVDGELELKNGKKISIETLCLEEDSARKIKEEKDFIVYRLDRLGIPLVEIATSPDLNTPEEVKEAAEKIGMLLRSTKVKRGLGTIRQDINISIKDGERVEIKGAQNLDLIPELVKNEVERQLDLLNLRERLWEILGNLLNQEFKEEKEKIKEKKDLENIFKRIKEVFEKKQLIKTIYFEDIDDLKNFTKDLESKILKNKKIVALVFPNEFKGVFGFKIGKKRFGSELAQRIKLYGFKGLIHSDEDLKKYKLKEEEINKLKEKLGNSFILIAFNDYESKNVEKALDAIKERFYYAFIGVPKETRKANEDGTTTFLRPMPGKARMYPETDLPLFEIKEFIPTDEEMPKTLEEKEKDLEKLVGKELARQLIKHYKLNLFEELVEKYRNLNPKTIAYLFTNVEKEMRRDYGKELKEEEIIKIVELLDKDLIVKEAIIEALIKIDFNKDLNEIIKELEEKDLKKLTFDELKNRILKKIDDLRKKGMNEKAIRGLIIKEFRTKAEVQKIMDLLKNI
jgi:glutamyl-tRNA(Gln) amidotransferase subunit E